MDDFFTFHGYKPGRHFLLSCSEVNSTGYSRFDEPITQVNEFNFTYYLFVENTPSARSHFLLSFILKPKKYQHSPTVLVINKFSVSVFRPSFHGLILNTWTRSGFVKSFQ